MIRCGPRNIGPFFCATRQSTKEIAATGSVANGADFVSGMALATGDCRHKDKKTPAASAVPLTDASFRPRYPDQPYSFA